MAAGNKWLYSSRRDDNCSQKNYIYMYINTHKNELLFSSKVIWGAKKTKMPNPFMRMTLSDSLIDV